MTLKRLIRGVALLAGIVLLLTATLAALRALANLPGLATLTVIAVAAYVITIRLKRRVPRGTVLEIDLDGGVVEEARTDPLSRAMTRNATTVRDIVDALDRASNDPRVIGVVARLGNGGIQLGQAQEIAASVMRMNDAGKRTVAFSESFGEVGLATVDYYLASAFSQIYLQPGGTTSIQGVVGRGRFIRGVFDKLGVTADFGHRHEYKAAMYSLTETEFVEPHRDAVTSLTGDMFDQIVSGIARGRGLTEDAVRFLIDRSPLLSNEALEAGLVDHLGFRDEAFDASKEGGSGFMYHGVYLKRAGRPNRKGNRIGLIYGTGGITRGRSGFDPLSQQPGMGADAVAKAFRMAVADKKTKAIVFRVDSPGGSAVGSNVVRREVLRAQEAGKPVVVSMGNVAASGGYWVSANADRIVAQPGTITGSIGVVAGKLATREAWAKVGITFDQVPFGTNSTYSSPHDPFTGPERERLDAGLDDIYSEFTALVAEARNMKVAEVHEIAKGRVWTGAQALENGLVDKLGGLDTAIAEAKTAAGITSEDTVRVTVFPKKRTSPIPERTDSSDPVEAALAAVIDLVRGARLGLAGVQARMPDLG